MGTKILIIDDSALMRRKLTEILQGAGYEIKTARDGEQGLEVSEQWKPDLITLDINMPVMDGLTCLSLLMVKTPCPVIMVSSLTEKGALATFEALELGAVDYVAKPDGTVSVNMSKIENELMAKISAALQCNNSALRTREPIRSQPKPVDKPKPLPAIKAKSGIVVIGSSTGGPSTLELVLQGLPADFPVPIVVAQHMPEKFTKVFASRLNSSCAIEVVHVDKPYDLQPGKAYIGRGDADVTVVKRVGKLQIIPVPESEHLWHPSVSLLMSSVNEHFDAKSVIGVMLTGMGSDGSVEMSSACQKGAKTIAESEDSCVVFGMPKELIAKGGATKILDKSDISNQVIKWAERL